MKKPPKDTIDHGLRDMNGNIEIVPTNQILIVSSINAQIIKYFERIKNYKIENIKVTWEQPPPGYRIGAKKTAIFSINLWSDFSSKDEMIPIEARWKRYYKDRSDIRIGYKDSKSLMGSDFYHPMDDNEVINLVTDKMIQGILCLISNTLSDKTKDITKEQSNLVDLLKNLNT